MTFWGSDHFQLHFFFFYEIKAVNRYRRQKHSTKITSQNFIFESSREVQLLKRDIFIFMSMEAYGVTEFNESKKILPIS